MQTGNQDLSRRPFGKKSHAAPCGSTSEGRPVAVCSALCYRGNPPVVQLLERAEHFLYLDGFSLDGSARRTPLPLSSGKTRRTESTSTSIPLLPIAPISLRMRSDSDSWPAASVALLPRPSTPRGTIRRTWCRDHAEDIGRGAGVPVPPSSRFAPSAGRMLSAQPPMLATEK